MFRAIMFTCVVLLAANVSVAGLFHRSGGCSGGSGCEGGAYDSHSSGSCNGDVHSGGCSGDAHSGGCSGDSRGGFLKRLFHHSSDNGGFGAGRALFRRSGGCSGGSGGCNGGGYSGACNGGSYSNRDCVTRNNCNCCEKCTGQAGCNCGCDSCKCNSVSANPGKTAKQEATKSEKVKPPAESGSDR